MNRILVVVVLLMAVSSVAVGQMPGGTTANADSLAVHAVLHTERAIDEAAEKGDVTALDTLLAEEVTRTTAGRGTLTTKAQWLAEIKEAIRTTGRSSSVVIQTEAQQVRLYGETAVVTGIVHRRREGASAPTPIRYLHVYVHRQGHWQLVANQGTRIGQPWARRVTEGNPDDVGRGGSSTAA